MKIATGFSFVLVSSLLGATAYADAARRVTPAATRDATAADGVRYDGVRIESAGRLDSDKLETQAVVAQLQSRFGEASWYESATDAELEGAPGDVRIMLSRLSALSVDMGDKPIANTDSVVDGIRDRVAAERRCRSDETCLAERSARRAEAHFLASVVAPLCEAEAARESAQQDIVSSAASGVARASLVRAGQAEVQKADKEIHKLAAEYTSVRHHSLAGWRSECE